MTLHRTSGVLLHPTSLPGPHGSGDLGAGAYHFVDWLATAQQKIWQILPLGGIGPGNSPYMSSSAFAGNVLLIDLHELQQHGWLDPKDLQPDTRFKATRVNFSAVVPWRMQRLQQAADAFAQSARSDEHSAFAAFCTQHARWLDDYALFMALNEVHGGRDWSDWPSHLAHRKALALLQARREHATRIEFWQFCQWCFFRQWHALKQYANAKGIQIVGDVPIFISYQSADVWARPELFELDSDARVTVVAGVPPDYFSTTGQRWGNPLYRWSAHASENYAWWVERIRHTFELVDRVRIDHFRGFAAYWEILASEPTAVMGRWKPGPGAALFDAIHAALGHLPIIAEDLGVITPDVDALRLQFPLPGMRVLQFAFGTGQIDDNANAYLPHNYEINTVVYTGTHDNNTTQGWWADLPGTTQNHVQDYLGYKVSENAPIHWALIRLACASVAHIAIHPMQDVLGLGAEHRMNMPGKEAGYWEWRFQWEQVAPTHAQTLTHLCQLYRRI
jgi:4-alpha-glucanotransferase